MKNFRVGILGATGVVGQRFIQLLQDHPQFEVTALAASDRSQGKTFAEACTWRLPGEMPEAVKQIIVQHPAPPLDCDFIFSSLPGDIAIMARKILRALVIPVISNSSSHRMGADVPLLIPEVNPDHLELIEVQRTEPRLRPRIHCHESKLLGDRDCDGARAATCEVRRLVVCRDHDAGSFRRRLSGGCLAGRHRQRNSIYRRRRRKDRS